MQLDHKTISKLFSQQISNLPIKSLERFSKWMSTPKKIGFHW